MKIKGYRLWTDHMEIHYSNLIQTLLQVKLAGILATLVLLNLISTKFPILPQSHTSDHHFKMENSQDFINMSAEIRGLFDEASYTSNMTYLRGKIPDVIDELPDRYLKNYKSFCWFNTTNIAQLLCLPRIHLGGFIKCGSSDIHQKLTMHGEIVHGLVKEHK